MEDHGTLISGGPRLTPEQLAVFSPAEWDAAESQRAARWLTDTHGTWTEITSVMPLRTADLRGILSCWPFESLAVAVAENSLAALRQAQIESFEMSVRSYVELEFGWDTFPIFDPCWFKMLHRADDRLRPVVRVARIFDSHRTLGLDPATQLAVDRAHAALGRLRSSS